MVDLDSSQIALKRFHFLQDRQYPDYKEFTSCNVDYDRMGFEVPIVNPYLFVVDWQISESEDVEVTREPANRKE
jgi:hypothetical protein